MSVQESLNKNRVSSNLIEVKLPLTKSHIIRENNFTIYCSVYTGLRGSFRKDVEETKKFGRKICDEIKNKLKNDGFFTSDELPNYGITKAEIRAIFEKTKAGKSDLVAIFAYDRINAQKTKDCLDTLLRQDRNCV